MTRLARPLLSAATVLGLLSAGAVAATAQPTTPTDPAGSGASPVLVNGDFESGGLAGWEVDAPASVVDHTTEAHSGRAGVRLDFAAAGEATVSQTLTDVPDGTYTVSAWTRTTGLDSATLSAGDRTWRRTGLPQAGSWKPVVVRGVPVTTGELEVALQVTGAPGQSALVDDVTLVPDEPSTDFLLGGDLTYVNYVESMGGEFTDEAGADVDPFEFMAERGVNLARLRLYNDTGPEHHRIGEPGSYLPEGFLDPDDVLDLARRAHAAGMQIQLTFHYSDYWSNGEIQDIPLEWRDVTQLPEDQAVAALEKHVADFTADFLQRMADQGTPPAFVSLGNEIQGGILFPYGHSWKPEGSFDTIARLLSAGAGAVDEVAPDAKVILHLDDAGNDDKYEWFFGELVARDVPFDIIGSSYYPFWTQKDVPTAAAFFERVSTRFDKPIMVMETGINWSPVTADGVDGQLTDNGPVRYGETTAGQRDFLRELFAALKAVPDGVVLGDVYWDPVMIAVPGVGWQVGAPNVISNTTLFDFDGTALPAFRAYTENMPSRRGADAPGPEQPAPATDVSLLERLHQDDSGPERRRARGDDHDLVLVALERVLQARPGSSLAVLSDPQQPVTALLPDDDAVMAWLAERHGRALPDEVVAAGRIQSRAQMSVDELEHLLLAHVVPGRTLDRRTLLLADGQRLTTAAGEELVVHADGERSVTVTRPATGQVAALRLPTPEVNEGRAQVGHALDRLLG